MGTPWTFHLKMAFMVGDPMGFNAGASVFLGPENYISSHLQ